jgi:hypothetical protein
MDDDLFASLGDHADAMSHSSEYGDQTSELHDDLTLHAHHVDHGGGSHVDHGGGSHVDHGGGSHVDHGGGSHVDHQGSSLAGGPYAPAMVSESPFSLSDGGTTYAGSVTQSAPSQWASPQSTPQGATQQVVPEQAAPVAASPVVGTSSPGAVTNEGGIPSGIAGLVGTSSPDTVTIGGDIDPAFTSLINPSPSPMSMVHGDPRSPAWGIVGNTEANGNALAETWVLPEGVSTEVAPGSSSINYKASDGSTFSTPSDAASHNAETNP